MSRSRFEDMQRSLERVNDANAAHIVAMRDWAIAELRLAQDREADLLTKYQQLKLQGYVEPSPAAPALPDVQPDPVELALIDVGVGLPPELRQAQREQATRDLRTGISPMELAMRIRQGSRPMDEIE